MWSRTGALIEERNFQDNGTQRVTSFNWSRVAEWQGGDSKWGKKGTEKLSNMFVIVFIATL